MDRSVDGIVLRCTPLRDVSWVSAAYTKELGLISFVTPKSKAARAAIQPYARLELVVRPAKSGDLFRLVDYSSINAYLPMRENLSRMRSAALCASALLKSQMPGKPSEGLFIALCRHMEEIAKSEEPRRIGAQFVIKLLKHDGLLEAPPVCSECGRAIGPAVFSHTGIICPNCSKQAETELSAFEYLELKTLFESRRVLEGEADPLFIEKLQEIFTQKVGG